MTRQLFGLFAILAASFLVSDGARAEDGTSAVEAWQADPTIVFEASDINVDDFLWIARPVVVFANTSADPAFQRQVDLIQDRIVELTERDVVVVTDADPSADSDLRQQLRPRGFMLVVMNKAGQVSLRKPSPWDVREITRSIDKMPERQQELRERRRQPLTD
jgi:hypothetical protein